MKKEKKTFSKDCTKLLKKYEMLPTSLEEIHEVIKDSFKNILQEAFEAELDGHLGYEKYKTSESTNSRNGYSPKTAKGMFGQMNLNVPRDRDASFKPRILPKHKKDVLELEKKVILLYTMGTSTSDAIVIIKDIYGINMNPHYISKITEQLLPKIDEFRTRRLEKIYPMIFIKEIRFKTREEEISKNVSIYIVLGYKMDGAKEVLGYWIGESESSRYWLPVFNDLKSRGLEEVLNFSSDNLVGISQAISTAYPSAKIQKCIVY